MRLLKLRAAATALGAMERPRGDRISVWSGDAAPEVFQGLKVENRSHSWVVYIPPRLFASGIADSLRHREHNGVAVYRMAFGGVVYVGEGRCIDTETAGVHAVRCQVMSATFLNFSREWMLDLMRGCGRVTREFLHGVLNATNSALKSIVDNRRWGWPSLLNRKREHTASPGAP